MGWDKYELMEEIWFFDEQIRDEQCSQNFDIRDQGYRRLLERRAELKGFLDEMKDNEE